MTVVISAILFAGLMANVPPTSAVHDDNLFELGPAQGADILGDGVSGNGPDWADIFDASGSPVGVGTFGGVTGSFITDQLSQSGAVDDTTYSGAGGSNKNNDPISGAGDTWHWDTGNVPAKDDISNVYAYATINPANGNLIIYSGFERLDPSGDSHVDIEFFQDEVHLDEAPPCNDPSADVTPCEFVGTRTEGDIIVSMDFTVGGSIGSVTIREFIGSEYVLVESVGGEGCNAADTACAFNNGGLVNGGPWPNFDRHGTTITNLERNSFTEFGFDVTALPGDTPCLTSFMGKTRSSQSFTAELKDFGGPTAFDICAASITIAPDDVNGVGEEHTFTVTASKRLGALASPADDGTIVIVTLTDANGAISSVSSNTCASPGTNGGTCTITFTSNTAGTVTGHASADILVLGQTFHVETDGTGDNSGDAVKVFVAGSIRWTKVDNAGQLQGGATFEVCRTHNFNSDTLSFVDIADVCVDVVDNTAPDQDADAGEFLLAGLALGRYTVKESVTPLGFVGDPDTVTVELTLSSPDAVIGEAFHNERPILKLTEFGYTNTPTGTPTSGVVSGITTYTVVIKNFGTADASLDISLTVTGGSGQLTYVGSTGPAGVIEPSAGSDCSGGCTASWTGLSVAPGAQVTIEVTVEYANTPDGTVVDADLVSTYTTNGLTRSASGSPASIAFTIQGD